jgi:hypothetical protein
MCHSKKAKKKKTESINVALLTNITFHLHLTQLKTMKIYSSTLLDLKTSLRLSCSSFRLSHLKAGL